MKHGFWLEGTSNIKKNVSIGYFDTALQTRHRLVYFRIPKTAWRAGSDLKGYVHPFTIFYSSRARFHYSNSAVRLPKIAPIISNWL